jgi:hypothetical protein
VIGPPHLGDPSVPESSAGPLRRRTGCGWLVIVAGVLVSASAVGTEETIEALIARPDQHIAWVPLAMTALPAIIAGLVILFARSRTS